MSCTAAPAISAGTSVVVGNIATYTCNTGYKMNGRAKIECISNTWEGSLPECLLINEEPTNNYFLDVVNNQEEIPKWLLYLVAVAAGLAVLLLIFCVIVLVVKSCCNSKVSPESFESPLEEGYLNRGCPCCFGFGAHSRRLPLNDGNESSNRSRTKQIKRTEMSTADIRKSQKRMWPALDRSKTGRICQLQRIKTRSRPGFLTIVLKTEKKSHIIPRNNKQLDRKCFENTCTKLNKKKN